MRRLERKAIDNTKWDACISRSASWRNPLYGYSWYLDHTATPQWYGLIWGDYDAVAPVCVNRKLIWSQVYRPAITQQLGVYGSEVVDSQRLTDLYVHLQQYRRCHYTLPSGTDLPKEASYDTRSNYQLHVQADKTALQHVTSKSQRQHVLQVSKHLAVNDSTDVSEHVDFVKEVLKAKYAMSNQEASVVKRIGQYLLDHDKGYIIQATDDKGLLLSSSLVAVMDGYATLLLGGTSDLGRQLHTRSLLIFETIDRAIKQGLHCVDFEGSQIPGVAKFFSSFGAKDKPYLHLSHDRMPWPINVLRPA